MNKLYIQKNNFIYHTNLTTLSLHHPVPHMIPKYCMVKNVNATQISAKMTLLTQNQLFD